MKNIFKLFSIALAASVMMFTACTEEETTNNGTDSTGTTTTYTVTVNCNDATLGTVSIEPAQTSYEAGTEVTITATPASNANFLYWNGTITDNPYTFTVSENVTYTATFEAQPEASYAATFDGTALDVAGYSDAQCANQNGSYVFLFQCAQNAEGTTVYFPYLVNYLTGTSTTDMAVQSMELYKDTYYTSGDDNYGDWQYYRAGTNTVNCTALDLTSYTLTATMSVTMYSLTDVVENGAQTDGSDATHKTLALTLTNMSYELYTGKGHFGKMNPVK